MSAKTVQIKHQNEKAVAAVSLTQHQIKAGPTNVIKQEELAIHRKSTKVAEV